MKESKPFKTWHIVFLLIVILLSIGNRIYNSVWKKAVVKIGGEEVLVLVADNYKHQIQGWSNKKNMGKYGGMLFIFPNRGQHAMVMRDMHFALDIVWLDGNKIVDIAPNLPPDTAINEEDLILYRARTDSTMVLELPAGFKDKTALKIGDEVQIFKD